MSEKNEKKPIDINTVLSILDSVGKIVVDTEKKYGFIHKQAFINYFGRKGRLVWDYILINELTFEDAETGEQRSLGTSVSDKKIEAIFNELVEKFGV